MDNIGANLERKDIDSCSYFQKNRWNRGCKDYIIKKGYKKRSKEIS